MASSSIEGSAGSSGSGSTDAVPPERATRPFREADRTSAEALEPSPEPAPEPAPGPVMEEIAVTEEALIENVPVEEAPVEEEAVYVVPDDEPEPAAAVDATPPQDATPAELESIAALTAAAQNPALQFQASAQLGRLLLRTWNPPDRTSAWDWAFWRDIVIE